MASENPTVLRFVHEKKALFPMYLNEEGKFSSVSPVHPIKEKSLILSNTGEKITPVIFSHFLKALAPIVTTEDAILKLPLLELGH